MGNGTWNSRAVTAYATSTYGVSSLRDFTDSNFKTQEIFTQR